MTEDQAEYTPVQIRLKSVVLKDVKVKKEPAIRVTVKWEKMRDDGSWGAMGYASTREPQMDFWTAIEDLLPHALLLLELPTDYSKNCGVTAVKMSYDEDGNQIATTLVRKLTASGECKLETSDLPASGDYQTFQTQDYHMALLAVEAEALQFAAAADDVVSS